MHIYESSSNEIVDYDQNKIIRDITYEVRLSQGIYLFSKNSAKENKYALIISNLVKLNNIFCT